MVGWFLRSWREYKCEHDWEKLGAIATYETNVAPANGLPVDRYFLFRCKKCGMSKTYR